MLKLWKKIRTTLKKIIKTISWFPVIWHDTDWDYSSIFYLLDFKLDKMEKAFRSQQSVSVYAPIAAKQMKYARFLIDRIMKDDYCKKEYETHEQKWGKLIHNTIPIEGSTNVKVDFYRTKARATGQEKTEKAESWQIIELNEKRREEDLDRLFRHIRKYIQRWWD